MPQTDGSFDCRTAETANDNKQINKKKTLMTLHEQIYCNSLK